MDSKSKLRTSGFLLKQLFIDKPIIITWQMNALFYWLMSLPKLKTGQRKFLY
jgi:hypothetical protein